MKRPAFLTKPMMPTAAEPKARQDDTTKPPRPTLLSASDPVRAGSLTLVTQHAPWRYTLLHDRPDNVLVWLTRGQGMIIVNGVRRGFGTNQAMYLPAGTLFAFDMPQGAQGLMLQCPAGLTKRMPREVLHLRVRDSLAQAEIIAAIDTMGRELMQERPLMQDALAAYAALAAIWLHRQVQGGAVEQPRDSASSRLTTRFAQALLRNYQTSQSVSDYAEALDVTPTHLTRVCRKSCGKTAVEFLAERKLHAAQMALTTSKQPIKDIAAALGFASAPYFTRFIQTQTGQTPSALRRAALGASQV